MLRILRRMQEEYQDKGKKLCMCFVDLEKAFDQVPRKVMEWAMRKKKVTEIMVKAVMSLHKGAKTKVKVGSSLFDELSVNVGVHRVTTFRRGRVVASSISLRITF